MGIARLLFASLTTGLVSYQDGSEITSIVTSLLSGAIVFIWDNSNMLTHKFFVQVRIEVPKRNARLFRVPGCLKSDLPRSTKSDYKFYAKQFMAAMKYIPKRGYIRRKYIALLRVRTLHVNIS